MRKGYIRSFGTVAEFQEIVKQMYSADIEPDNMVINQPFDEFVATLESGDLLIVYSVNMFSSLADLLTKSVELIGRGVRVESLTDPWFSIAPDQMVFLQGIRDVGRKLGTERIKRGQERAKAGGKKLGRPVGSTRIDTKVKTAAKLYKSSQISISKACKIAGCNPRSYYRYMGKNASPKQ